jgi:DegV family protein with EDD domain
MTKIITDTTACLSSKIQSKYDIRVVPQLIHFGEDTFMEGIDMDHSSFMERLQSSSFLPKTAAPPPELFCEIFHEWKNLDETIFCIHPSTDLSGTVRSALIASQDFPDLDIQVIDTRIIASPLGVLVHKCAELAESGAPSAEIHSLISKMASQCRIFFLVPSLEYLARGGRIGGASALVGNVLNVKPILNLEDGSVQAYLKERTLPRALNRLRKLIVSHYPLEKEGYLTIMHADNREAAQELANYFSDELDIPPAPITFLPPAIITHAGPGTLAVGVFS